MPVEINLEKQKRLAYVARRYYLEDQKQSDIARELGVSRPLVSRMLSEARELGLYMQKYCGCVFSEEDRYLGQKKKKQAQKEAQAAG